MKITNFYSLLMIAMITIICGFTAQAAPQNNNQQFALDRILVVAEAGMINPNSFPDLGIAFSKIELLNPTKTIPDAKDIFLIHLENPSKKEIIRVIRILKENPIIISAERDYYHAWNVAQRTPNDPRFGQQWHLQAINAPQAWGITTGSRQVRVGIMDSGLDLVHEDLRDNLWVNPNPNQTIGGFTFVNDIHGWNFSTNSAVPPSSGTHGTHVAGIVGAVGNNGIGISGVCWEVSLVMLAIQASSSRAVRALEYANYHNIQIAQNSWGSYGSPNRALYEAIRNYNGLFVISAGNSRGDLEHVDNSGMHYPLGYSLDGEGLHGFGPGLTNIISVMASNINDGRSGNFGATRVMIAAPGVNILSTYPTHTGILYRDMTGSSMAAPVVSGVAALMMSARIENHLPQLSPQQIISILMSTARQVTTAANANRAGGVVDAYAAVRMALTFCTECENAGCPNCPPNICLVCGEPDCQDIHVTGILLNKPAENVLVGTTEQLTVTFLPNDATNQNVTWTSDNENVATVDQNGLVTAVANGTAIIIVTTEDGGFTRTSVITVITANVTVDNIATFVQDPNVESIMAFLGNGTATYEITHMAPRLNTWREAYRTAFPQFDRFLFVMPSISTSTSAAPAFPLALRITYLAPIGNVWNFVTDTVGGIAPTLHIPALVPMTGGTNNPNSDATFTRFIRTDRTNTSAWGGATPHSTTAPNFGQTAGSNAHNAILGIFTPSGTGSGLGFTLPNNIAYLDDNFIGFLNSPTGFTVIQDEDRFWFRNKAEPTDWFLVEPQRTAAAAVTGVTLNHSSWTVVFDETATQTFQLTANVLPVNAANTRVTWTSSNPAVATVDEIGLVTAISIGRATITVTSNDGSFRAQCAVVVNAPTIAVTGVTLNESAITLYAGETEELLETVLPINATDQSVTWSSSNSAVATVDESGLVTAVSAGIATITVTTIDGGFTATSTITVRQGTGIIGLDDDGTIKLYPNPVTNGRLFVEISDAFDSQTIQIHDLSGRLVLTQVATRPRTEINVSHLHAGVYIVSIGTTSTRIVIQ